MASHSTTCSLLCSISFGDIHLGCCTAGLKVMRLLVILSSSLLFIPLDLYVVRAWAGISIPILEWGKLRYKELKGLDQGHQYIT